MIQAKLFATENKQNLYIDVKVSDLAYFYNRFITSIKIDTDKTFNPDGPSESSVEVFSAGINDGLQITTEVGRILDTTTDDYYNGYKHVELIIPKEDLPNIDLNKDILYIYVEEGGKLSEDTPSDLIKDINMFICYDDYKFVSKFINANNHKECGNISEEYISAFFQYQCFKQNIKIGNYIEANELWESVK